MTSEGKVQRQIVKYLEDNGWIVFKLMAVSRSGVPDLICHKGGKTLYVEVKAEHGRLSDIQKYRIAQLRKTGIPVIITNNLKYFKGELNGQIF